MVSKCCEVGARLGYADPSHVTNMTYESPGMRPSRCPRCNAPCHIFLITLMHRVLEASSFGRHLSLVQHSGLASEDVSRGGR